MRNIDLGQSSEEFKVQLRSAKHKRKTGTDLENGTKDQGDLKRAVG